MLMASVGEGLACWGRKADGLLLGDPLGGCGDTEAATSWAGVLDGERLPKGRSGGGVPTVVVAAVVAAFGADRSGVEATRGWKRTDCW